MEYRPKIHNSSKFSRNPWIPSKILFYKPVRTGSTDSGIDSDTFKQNMCRLCLIFPTIKVHFIQKIYKLLQYNIMQSIDTLLYIKNMRLSGRLRKQMSIRKRTSARCCPIVKKTLFQRIIEEEEERDGDRVILPNITFGRTSCQVHYENNLNLTPVTVPEYNEVNPVDEVMHNDEENVEVICNDYLSPSNHQLRSPRPAPGYYSAVLKGNTEAIYHYANKPEISPSSIRLLIQRQASGYYSSKLTGEENVETLGQGANESGINLFDIGQNNHLI